MGDTLVRHPGDAAGGLATNRKQLNAECGAKVGTQIDTGDGHKNTWAAADTRRRDRTQNKHKCSMLGSRGAGVQTRRPG